MSQAIQGMQGWCHLNSGFRNALPVIEIKDDDRFGPKSSGLVAPEPSDENIDALRLSD
jgi:hypothetical protein